MIDASKASDTTKVSPEPTTFSAVTGTATPTATPIAATIIETSKPVNGPVTFEKLNKTAGEAVVIKVATSNKKKDAKITLTAKAKATKGKVSYKFAAQKKNGKIKTLKGFSAKKKFIWKPKQKGTYTLYVYVKNGKGVLVKKTINFKIK